MKTKKVVENKWTKLLTSISPELRQAYEKNVGVDLEKEVRDFAIAERRDFSLPLYGIIASFSVLAASFICVFVFSVEFIRVHEKAIAITTLVVVVLIITAMLVRLGKNGIHMREVLKKLEAFEEVIDHLDPIDLNRYPIRDAWVLDGKDIKENLAKLAKKVLLAQGELEFYRNCAYANVDDLDRADLNAEKLSKRLDYCLELAANFEIGYLRSKAILEAKELSGVREKQYSQVEHIRISHSHGDLYYIHATALYPDSRPSKRPAERTRVYLHRDGIWRSEATTPDPNNLDKSLDTGYFTKEEAEAIISNLELEVRWT